MARNGHSMVELVVAVLLLAVLTSLAVPRLRFDSVGKMNAEAVARRIGADLRLVRSRAILQATQSPAGCAATMTGSEPYQGYDIVDLGDSSIITSHDPRRFSPTSRIRRLEPAWRGQKRPFRPKVFTTELPPFRWQQR